MKGHTEVVDYLKHLLKGELAARDQYFIHSRLYEDWGFSKLYERINHEMEEETQHADALLKRIIFLEGVPDMVPNAFTFGQTVPEALKLDLALEYEVRAALSKGIELCEKHQDYQTRDILLAQLKDTEEDHAYWLEIQLQLIDKLGLEKYLQSQM
ncbi:bacterioferritin [Ectopseudomonas mendocina]|uniref:Bacterioferritin n=1 Tax=Ectopseudomonas mendocina TaxID=300 RepID=A0A379IQP7_ECTME|nr:MULTISPECIES: bacterioferritin [Pseudomonas]MDF2075393.1 bacterioferritin [Pseudomonas mendocina]TRO10395.1 bacterioferritin [Pseudomonas mendocina]TRO12271.1 bacterioferritin [Pseudomonas mendocina]SUD38401.1 bacterioferritin [Pseudomonas mendocina]VEE17448.1 bacterioferritin [Pseudomonas mendocina]